MPSEKYSFVLVVGQIPEGENGDGFFIVRDQWRFRIRVKTGAAGAVGGKTAVSRFLAGHQMPERWRLPPRSDRQQPRGTRQHDCRRGAIGAAA